MSPDNGMGPPENEDGAPKGPTDVEGLPHPATKSKPNALTRQCASDTRPWRRRRRRAADRCEPLGDSGNIRDPWQPWRPETLSEKQVAGAVDAARHLRDAGLEPMFDLPTMRAMWKAGHHQLVDDLRGGR